MQTLEAIKSFSNKKIFVSLKNSKHIQLCLPNSSTVNGGLSIPQKHLRNTLSCQCHNVEEPKEKKMRGKGGLGCNFRATL